MSAIQETEIIEIKNNLHLIDKINQFLLDKGETLITEDVEDWPLLKTYLNLLYTKKVQIDFIWPQYNFLCIFL